MSEDKYSLDQLRIDRDDSGTNRGRKRLWLLALLLIAIVAGATYAVVKGRPVPVRTHLVRAAATGGSQTVLNASGYVVARRQATVSSKITGKVVEVLVEEGMKVEEGQVLARLDDSNVKAGFHESEAQLAAARATLDETKARLADAEKGLRRISMLTEQKIATIADLDRAEAEVKALSARLRQQEVQALVVEKTVAVWQQQLEDTVIRAPFSGIAVVKNAQPGEMISPISAGGGFTRTGIGTIVDMKSLEIEVDVNESFINRVQSGQAVEATLDAYPDWNIPCKVIAIIPTADRQKATVKVRVGFGKLDPRILPEMGVRVAFKGEPQGSASRAATVVPKAAIRKEDGRDVVWIVQEGRLKRRAVTVGLTSGEEVTVNAGLVPGEKVVVEGPAKPLEGQRVRDAEK